MNENNSESEVLYRVEQRIGTLVFNRPESRNALTFAMYDALKEICEAESTPATVDALIIVGADERAFAAGTDISQFHELRSDQDAWDYEQRIDSILAAIEACPVPTIAALAGACTGGGAGIAVACDLRIAAANLKFGFPIARTLGNCLSAVNLRRLAALMGAGRVREMLFTSRLIEAEEALAIGLVSELVADHDALLARAGELARTVAGQAPLTLRATKEALRRLQSLGEVDDRDLIAMCYTSEDFREGMRAFLDKRKPEWKGR